MTSRQAINKLNGSIANFLSLDEQFFEEGIGSWQAIGASADRNIGFRFKDNYHTLDIKPFSSDDVILTCENKQIPISFSTDFITFYAFVYCEKRTQLDIVLTNSQIQTNITITGTLNSYDLLPIPGQVGDSYLIGSEIYSWNNIAETWDIVGTQQTESTVVSALTWTVIRGPKIPIPRTAIPTLLDLKITASSHLGARFFMAHPSLVNTLHLVDNLFLRQCMTYMPEILIETDRNQTLPDFPMLRMMDVGTLYANRGVNQLDSFKYRDIEEGFRLDDPSTRSKLIDPTVAETAYLPWIAQIVGVSLSQSGGGTTPWGNLPKTWQTFSNAVDSAGDEDNMAEWFEIEGFDVSDSNFDDSTRTQIATARTGYNSGLISSFSSIIEGFTTGNKEHKIYTDSFASPWTIIIRTLVSETPGGVNGEPSELLVAALYKTKPMGFVIDHQCVTAL